jgi:hypothetical protein
VVLDRIRGLFKGKKPEKPGAEKPSPQDVVEFALDDLKSGLLDGSYATIIWEKACGDPGLKPDLQNVVAVIDGGSLLYASIAEGGKIVTLEQTSGAVQGLVTVYIITRSFLDEIIKRCGSHIRSLGIDQEEVATIRIFSPETLKKHGVEADECMAVPIPRSLAGNIINEIVSEIEKRLRGAVEGLKQMGLPQKQLKETTT